MRVVFDSNIYVSALAIPGGNAEKAVLKVIDGKDTLIVSKEILNEVLTTLAKKFSRDHEELSRVAVMITEMARIVSPKKRLTLLEDDPDNRVLECAVAGNADAVVTGDKEMLRLKDYKGIRIMTLREYLEKEMDREA